MKTVSWTFLGLAVLCLAAPARAQVEFLQNDSWGGGALTCYEGIGDQESLAAKFTAQPAQYPYTIDRVRVFGCGGGQNPYDVFIWQDNGAGPTPGTLIWQSANSYILTGSNVFNDILMSSEPVPPPPITSGSIRVELYAAFAPDPIGFGSDQNGILPVRNFILTPQLGWILAENAGVTGDWILRLGIVAPSAQPSLSVLDVLLPEGNAGTSDAIVTVTLSPAATQAVTVNYATSDGTATAGSDYDAASGTLTFNIGQSVKTFPVPIRGDLIDEPNEGFIIELSGPTNAIIDRGTAQGTITDDDAAPALAVNDVSVQEGQTGTTSATFTVSMAGASAQSVTVDYATASGSASAPADYLSASGTLTFAPGQTARPVAVTVNGDILTEGNETFNLNLTSPVNATVSDSQGRATILDDEGLGYFAVTPCRLLDTRGGPPLSAGVERTVPVTGVCGIPATAKAIAVNLTVAQPSTGGFLKLFPSGEATPLASAMNYAAGKARANNGIFGLGTGGALAAVCGPSGTTHFILDVFGYFE
jgi:hypothetical protein